MYRRVKKLQVLIINKDVRKSLAHKQGNDILVWRWNDSLQSQLILVHFYFVPAPFLIERYCFSLVFHIYILFCTQNVVIFLMTFSEANVFNFTSKSRPTWSTVFCQNNSKSPTRNRYQWLTKDLLSAKQSIDFQIIVKRSGHRLIGLRSNKIYSLFIIEKSCKYQRRSVSSIVRYFYISLMSCTVLVVNWLIHQTRLLLFLYLISLNLKSRIIYQSKYNIIIYII